MRPGHPEAWARERLARSPCTTPQAGLMDRFFYNKEAQIARTAVWRTVSRARYETGPIHHLTRVTDLVQDLAQELGRRRKIYLISIKDRLSRRRSLERAHIRMHLVVYWRGWSWQHRPSTLAHRRRHWIIYVGLGVARGEQVSSVNLNCFRHENTFSLLWHLVSGYYE